MIKKYPLIVSDFDETLRNDEGTISPENAEAIRKYIAAGGIFAICTGRMMTSIHAARRKSAARQPSRRLSGRAHTRFKEREISPQRTYEREGGGARLPHARRNGVAHSRVRLRQVLRECGRRLLAAYERICKVKGKIVTSGMADFVVQNGIQPQKILAMVEPNKRRLSLKRPRNFWAKIFT